MPPQKQLTALRPKTSIHFIGIGGSGMSGLAGIFHEQGMKISGSDAFPTDTLSELETMGIHVHAGHSEKNIPAEAEIVVHTLAIPPENPELRSAKKRGLRILSYPQAVSLLTRHHRTIAVCGTHGKTTTTAMIARVLLENNFDPTILVGSQLTELKGRNFRLGKNSIMVLEACEYQRAFLEYFPSMIVLQTLDPEHLDYYRNFKNYLSAFRDFSDRLPQDGYFFANIDDEDVHGVLRHLQQKKFPVHNTFTVSSRYGESDFSLTGNKIVQQNAQVGELNLSIPGAHNRMNALSAFAVCGTLGVAPSEIIKSLNAYTGAARRFEEKMRIGRTPIIDDYAHHPAEIQATLQGARERFGAKAKILAVFQPHQYSRTRELLKDFGAAFGEAKRVIIPDIFAVRDTAKDIASVKVMDLVNEIEKNETDALDGKGIEKTAAYLKKNAKNFDAIIVMGAGDLKKIFELLEN